MRRPGFTPVSSSSVDRSWYVLMYNCESTSVRVNRFINPAVCHVVPAGIVMVVDEIISKVNSMVLMTYFYMKINKYEQ